MSKLFEKHNDIFDNIFEKNDKINKDININNEIEKMPEPTNYRISTMTLITSFDTNINLYVVNQYFKLDNKLKSMVYGDKPVKNINLKKKKNRPFFNQATIVVELNPLKIINVKIFSNGKIQMTGVKKKEYGLRALNLIIQKFKNTKGEIPVSKLLIRKQIELLLENLKLSTLPIDYFLEEYYVINKNNLYDIKFNKKIEEIINVDKIINTLIEYYKGDINIFSESIEDEKKIKIKDLDIVLINSDFCTNFNIKRNILHTILKNNYNIISRYEPGIYPGVNNKFFWNEDYKNKKYLGKCYCTKTCEGKGNGKGNGNCKKITIAVFQSGAIIITGARKIEHIVDTRNFIIKVLKENYELIKKIDIPFLDLEISKPKNNKKYIKTSDIKYISLKSLNNPYNKNTYDKFIELNSKPASI